METIWETFSFKAQEESLRAYSVLHYGSQML